MNLLFELLNFSLIIFLAICYASKQSIHPCLEPDSKLFFFSVSAEPSSTQSDSAEREVPSGSAQEPSDMDQSEQRAPASSPERQEVEEESSEPDSSSSSNELAAGPAASTDSTPSGADSPAEGSVELGDLDLENTEEPMEQD